MILIDRLSGPSPNALRVTSREIEKMPHEFVTGASNHCRPSYSSLRRWSGYGQFSSDFGKSRVPRKAIYHPRYSGREGVEDMEEPRCEYMSRMGQVY